MLFLIALRMIFPGDGAAVPGDALEGEPFVVPVATPLLAGPSTLAALLLQRSAPSQTVPLLVAATIAWALSGAILLGPLFATACCASAG